MQKQQKKLRKEKKEREEEEMEMQLKQDQAAARPRSPRVAWAPRDPCFWVFFFFLLWWTHILCWYGFLLLLSLQICLYFILVVNRVLKTWFPCRCHVEKLSHQMWTTHKNRVPKTRFIDPKSSLLNLNC